MTTAEYNHVSLFGTSHAVFEALRTRHEKLGTHAQMNLLMKEFTVFYDPSVRRTSYALRQMRTLTSSRVRYITYIAYAQICAYVTNDI